MVGVLNDPITFVSNSPLPVGQPLQIKYTGPQEADIWYELIITDRQQITVLLDTGRVPDSRFGSHFPVFTSMPLDSLGSPYTATLTLNFESNSCSNTYSERIEVSNRPTLMALSDTVFCEGGYVFLKATAGATNYSWYKDGVLIKPDTYDNFFRVTESGTYRCYVFNAQGITGMTNPITVNALHNPPLAITSECLGDSIRLTVTPQSGLPVWNTLDTAFSIVTAKEGGYWVQITQPDSLHCFRQASFAVNGAFLDPVPPMEINLLLGDTAYCSQGLPDTLRFAVSPGCYSCLYKWEWDSTTTYFDGNNTFSLPRIPDHPFQLTVTAINDNKCTAVSAPFKVYVDTACCATTPAFTFNQPVNSSSLSNWNNVHAAINDIFTIDNNFSIGNSELEMGKHAVIYIDSGKTLTMTDSRLAACSGMWQGIVLKGDNSILILNGDTIEDAVLAIDALSGGLVQIENSYLNKNRVHLKVNAHGTIYNGTITGTTFTSQNFNGTYCPLNNLGYSQAGIEIDSVARWVIGDSASSRNTFRYVFQGICSNNSNLFIDHCRFESNLNSGFQVSGKKPSYLRFSGYSILHESQVGTPRNSLEVKNSEFHTNGYGIACFKSGDVDIQRCQFVNSADAAIYSYAPFDGNVFIRDNDFSNCRDAIYLSEPRVAQDIILRENRIDYGNGLLQYDNRRAIVASNKLPGATSLKINNNLISKARLGIYAINAWYTDISNNQIEVVRIPSAFNTSYGIWVVNGLGSQVTNDTIVTPFGLGSPHEVRGIRMETCSQSRVDENYVLNTTTGLNFLNTCNDTYFTCNQMINCSRGLTFWNISLPKQGASSAPADNKWENIPMVNRSSGSGNPFDYWHRYGVNDITRFNPGYLNILTRQENATGNSPCLMDIDTLPADLSNLSLEVVRDSVYFPLFYESNKWQAEEYVFNLINGDSLLMQRGLPTDIEVEAFYQRMLQHNISFYEDIRGLLEQENYLQAIVELMNIQPEGELEADLSQVYDLLPDFLEKDLEPTASDSFLLQNIAYKLSAINGSAAFMARAILDAEIDDEITGPLLKLAYDNGSSEDFVKIFPNPASGHFSIELLNPKNDRIQSIELYDLKGVLNLQLSPNSASAQLSVSHIENGLYVVKVHTNNRAINTKLIWIKR